MKVNKGKIESWVITSQPKDFWLGIKAGGHDVVIMGIREGRAFKTSPIVEITPDKVVTLNSIYELGEPLFYVSEELVMKELYRKKEENGKI